MSIVSALDDLKAMLTGDSLVSAAATFALSAEGKQLAANLIGALSDLEAKHEADKQAAVQAAHAQGVADATPAVPEQS